MSNKHLATLSFDVLARERESQIEHQIAGAAGISVTVATPQRAAVGPWLAAFGIAAGLAAVSFFGTGFLLVTYTGNEMLATRSETAMATAVIPPMQTNAEAAREMPQTETIPEAAPSMQTNAEAARETPQTETTPGDAKWERPAAAPQMARAVPTKAVAKPSPSRQPKSLDDLIAQLGVASLPRPRPFFARTAKGQRLISPQIIPRKDKAPAFRGYHDAAE